VPALSEGPVLSVFHTKRALSEGEYARLKEITDKHRQSPKTAHDIGYMMMIILRLKDRIEHLERFRKG